MNEFPDTGDDVAALAAAVVQDYLAKYPGHRKRWRDDLHGEAALAIWSAWEKARDADDPEAYLRQCAWNAIGEFMEREAGQVRTRPELDRIVDKGANPCAAIDAWDTLESGCEDETDRAILELKRDGYSDREIAERLEFDGSGTVSKRLEKIRKRIQNSGSKTDPF